MHLRRSLSVQITTSMTTKSIAQIVYRGSTAKWPARLLYECNLPISDVTLTSHLVLLVANNRHFNQMLSSDTRAMCRFLDVVWRDLRVTFAMGMART